MKILLAIPSENNWKNIHKSLRWVSRTGYHLRIFIKDDEYQQYLKAMDEAAFDYYLHLMDGTLVTDYTPREYAKQYGFDIILTIRDDLPSFTGIKRNKLFDPEIVLLLTEVGKARIKLSKYKRKRHIKLAEGIEMERINNDRITTNRTPQFK